MLIHSNTFTQMYKQISNTNHATPRSFKIIISNFKASSSGYYYLLNLVGTMTLVLTELLGLAVWATSLLDPLLAGFSTCGGVLFNKRVNILLSYDLYILLIYKHFSYKYLLNAVLFS